MSGKSACIFLFKKWFAVVAKIWGNELQCW